MAILCTAIMTEERTRTCVNASGTHIQGTDVGDPHGRRWEKEVQESAESELAGKFQMLELPRAALAAQVRMWKR